VTRRRSSRSLTTVATTLAALALVAYVAWSERALPAAGPARAPAEAARPTPAAAGAGPVVRDQLIHDERGRLVYEGDIDLGPVFARIDAGGRDAHRNDGTVFANREGRLPKAARGYYTEWVVRTEGLRAVGPQRLITGQRGEAFYTPDHYETFVRVREPS